MIESSRTVHHEILQKELATMPMIKRIFVTTIQREQNRIIRNQEAHVLHPVISWQNLLSTTIKDTSKVQTVTVKDGTNSTCAGHTSRNSLYRSSEWQLWHLWFGGKEDW